MNPDSEGAGVSGISAALCSAEAFQPNKKMVAVTDSEQAELGSRSDHQMFL
jgi:hypothetical protein